MERVAPAGLVDEVHPIVGPAALGDGTPTFSVPADLTLREAPRFDGSNNVPLRYAAGQPLNKPS
ncbi:MAG: hypothetical protein ACRD2W_20470 [Acidimicrobiales bacterium]